jgi:hypothetical protein
MAKMVDEAAGSAAIPNSPIAIKGNASASPFVADCSPLKFK